MIHHRSEPDVQRAFDLGFGKRPQEELYVLADDPHYMNNVAGKAEYADVQAELERQLFAVLTEQDDPRVVEKPCRFEAPPYSGPATL
jgi:hypothetical protein